MAKFKKSVLEIMRSDADLYKKLSEALGVQPGSLRTVIDRNGTNLNQYSIVTLVASHLDKNPDELVETEIENEVVK
jgi:hypothetical protein